jgi:hypothetical protein
MTDFSRMPRKALVAIFNTKAEEFFDDLARTFPQVQDFKTFKTGLRLLLTVDERRAQKLFAKHIAANYRDQLLSKNDAFFFQDGFVESAIAAKAPTTAEEARDEWLSVIGRIKGVWSSMSSESKAAVWSYFQVLIALSDQVELKQP